jgi:hypothetical protein
MNKIPISQYTKFHGNKFVGKKFNYNSIYFFRYNNPKTKPHIWDKAPLVMPLYVARGMMLGLNIHWIPAGLRAQFINLVLELGEKTKKTGQWKKLPRLLYDMLKNGRFRFAIMGIRKYYVSRITNIQEIPPSLWDKLNPSSGTFKARKVNRITNPKLAKRL